MFDFLSLYQVERSLGKCDVNVADLWSAALQKQDLLEVLEADEPSAATPKNAEKEEKEKKEAPQEAANSTALKAAEEEYWMKGLSDALGADADANPKKRPAHSSTETNKKQAKPAEKEEKSKRDTLSQHKAKAKAEGKAKAEPKAKPEPKAKNDAKGKSGIGLAASFAKGSEVSSSASGPAPKKAKKA